LNSEIKKLLKPLASLRLTVALLLLSMLLVYSGTAVQKQMSAQDVQHAFFHSWVVRVPLDPFVHPFAAAGVASALTPYGFWTVGGYTLIALLLLNLLAAHSVRFKLNWKRSGIIAIHLGLIVLLCGEVFASLLSVESQMMIDQGQTVSYSYDLRHVELAIVDPSAADHDNVTVIDSSALKDGAVVHPPGLPFEIRVDNYYPNSDPVGPMEKDPHAVAKATAGENQQLKILPQPKIAGTEGARTDVASAFVTLSANGKNLGTYLVSQWAQQAPEFCKTNTVDVDGKTYRLDLRFRRYYKPYQVTLLKFSHDRYPGTDTPRNFSSRIRLVDPTRHVDREVLIWMNHPLTYPSLRGETLYQQSFLPNDRTTILEVTHNPFWPLPYIGLALGFLGLLTHFGIALITFLRRQNAAFAAPPVQRGKARGAFVPVPPPLSALATYTLQPKSRALTWLSAAVGAGLCATFFGFILATPVEPENGFDLAAFSKLPVNFEGRAMPLDTLARIKLKIISGRESFPDPTDSKKSLPAIRWLADTMFEVPGAFDAKVIRIDDPSILSQLNLNLDPKAQYFSLNDLLAHRDIVQKQFDADIQLPEKQRNDNERHMVELAQHVEQYLEVRNVDRLLLIPPAQDGGEKWLPIESAGGQFTAGSESIVAIMQDYHDGKPREFNTAVAQYHSALEGRLPDTMTKINYEVFLNHADPFLWCMWLYVFLVFVPACLSWMTWRGFFWPLAVGAMATIALYHTFGIVSRVYLTGWGPVTNLYSAATFIGWAVVLFAIGLELIYRNGVGAAAGAIVGFASLILAHFLGLDGDVMKPLQAVLMTKFWLWTHVPCVVLGYASTILAAVLAIVYVVLGLFTPMVDEPSGKALSRMVYAITCFAILFSFVGTILGGIWADYSWGRFWGWDPKENGAILIVLWNAIILHARWGGIVKQRGMMVLAILGIIVTSWSYFGTNLLGIGLHSYGFMEGAATKLELVWVGTLAMAVMGLVPLKYWSSFTPPKPPLDARASARAASERVSV
jgi:ABC-type transport system involved in cytochrome c biogenesis permease subunit